MFLATAKCRNTEYAVQTMGSMGGRGCRARNADTRGIWIRWLQGGLPWVVGQSMLYCGRRSRYRTNMGPLFSSGPPLVCALEQACLEVILGRWPLGIQNNTMPTLRIHGLLHGHGVLLGILYRYEKLGFDSPTPSRERMTMG